jgi:hypothetical protein
MTGMSSITRSLARNAGARMGRRGLINNAVLICIIIVDVESSCSINSIRIRDGGGRRSCSKGRGFK